MKHFQHGIPVQVCEKFCGSRRVLDLVRAGLALPPAGAASRAPTPGIAQTTIFIANPPGLFLLQFFPARVLSPFLAGDGCEFFLTMQFYKS